MLSAILEVIETEQRNCEALASTHNARREQELFFESAAGVLLAAHPGHKPRLFSSLLTTSGKGQLEKDYLRAARTKKNEDYSINLWGRSGTQGKTVGRSSPAASSSSSAADSKSVGSSSHLEDVPIAAFVEELALVRDMAALFALKYKQQCDCNKETEYLRAQRRNSSSCNPHALRNADAAFIDEVYAHPHQDLLSTSGIGALFCAVNPFAAFAVDNLPSTRERLFFESQAAEKKPAGSSSSAAPKFDALFIPSTTTQPFNIVLELIDALHVVLETHGTTLPQLTAVICETIAAVAEPFTVGSEAIKKDIMSIAEADMAELEEAAAGESGATKQQLQRRTRTYYAEAAHSGAEVLRFLMANPLVSLLSPASKACLCAAAVQLGVGQIFSPTCGLLSRADLQLLSKGCTLEDAFTALFKSLEKATSGYIRPIGAARWVGGGSSALSTAVSTASFANAHWALVDICANSLWLKSLDEDRLERLAQLQKLNHRCGGGGGGCHDANGGRRVVEAAITPTAAFPAALTGASNSSGVDKACVSNAALPLAGITVNECLSPTTPFPASTAGNSKSFLSAPLPTGANASPIAPLIGIAGMAAAPSSSSNLIKASAAVDITAVAPPSAFVATLLEHMLTRQHGTLPIGEDGHSTAAGTSGVGAPSGSSLFAIHLESLFEDGGEDLRNTMDSVCAALYSAVTLLVDQIAPDVWALLPRAFLPHLLEGFANAIRFGARTAAIDAMNLYRRVDHHDDNAGASSSFYHGSSFSPAEADADAPKLRNGFVVRSCVWRHIRHTLLAGVVDLTGNNNNSSTLIDWSGPEGASTLAAYAHLMVAVKAIIEASTASSSSPLSHWLEMLCRDNICVARASISSAAPYHNKVQEDQMSQLLVIAPVAAPQQSSLLNTSAGGAAPSAVHTTIASYLLQRAASGYGNVASTTETEVVLWRGTFALATSLLECASGWSDVVEALCQPIPVTEFLRDFVHAILGGPYHQWSHHNFSWRLQYEACNFVMDFPHLFENVPFLIATALKAESLEHALQAPASSLCAAKQIRLAHWLCERYPEALRTYAVDILTAVAAHVGTVGGGAASSDASSSASSAAAAKLADPHYEVFTSSWVEFVHFILVQERYSVLSLVPGKEQLQYLCEAIGSCAIHATYAAARGHQLVVHSQDTTLGFGCSHKARDVLTKCLEITALIAAKRPSFSARATVPLFADKTTHMGTHLSFIVVLVALLFENNSVPMAHVIVSLIADIFVHVKNGDVNAFAKAAVPSSIRHKLQALIERRLKESSLEAASAATATKDDKKSITATAAAKKDSSFSSNALSSKSKSAPTREPSSSGTATNSGAKKDAAGLNDDVGNSDDTVPGTSLRSLARAELSFARISALRTIFNHDNGFFFRLLQGVDADQQDVPSVDWCYNGLEGIVKNNLCSFPKEAAEALAFMMELQLDGRVAGTLKALHLSLTSAASGSPAFLASGSEEGDLWAAVRSGDLDALFENEAFFCSQSLSHVVFAAQLATFKAKAAMAESIGTAAAAAAPAGGKAAATSPSAAAEDAVAASFWMKEKDGEAASLGALAATVEALTDVTANLWDECALAMGSLDADDGRPVWQRHSYLGDGSITVKYPLSSKAARIAMRETESFNSRVLLGDDCDGDNVNVSQNFSAISAHGYSRQVGRTAYANASLMPRNSSAVAGNNTSLQLVPVEDRVALADPRLHSSRVTFHLDAAAGNSSALIVGSSDAVSKRSALAARRRVAGGSSTALMTTTLGRAQIVTSDAYEVDAVRFNVKRFPTMYGSCYVLSGTPFDPLFNMTLSVVDALTRVLKAVEAALLPVAAALSMSLATMTTAQLHQLQRTAAQAVRIGAVAKRFSAGATGSGATAGPSQAYSYEDFITAAGEALAHQANLVVVASTSIVLAKASNCGNMGTLAKVMLGSLKAPSSSSSSATTGEGVPPPQQLLVALEALLCNVEERDEDAMVKMELSTAAADSDATNAAKKSVKRTINGSVWARTLQASALMLRYVDVISAAAAGGSNVAATPSSSPLDAASTARYVLSEESRALRKSLGDKLMTMLAQWIDQHCAEAEAVNALAATAYAAAAGGNGAAAAADERAFAEIAQKRQSVAANTQIIHEIVAIVIGNLFGGNVVASGETSAFLRAAQLANPSVFIRGQSSDASDDSLLLDPRRRAASPAAVQLLKSLWAHAMVASADAYPTEAIETVFGNFSSSTHLGEAPLLTNKSNSNAFVAAVGAVSDLLAAVPAAAYHLDVDSIVGLMTVLGNNYDADTAVPSKIAAAVAAPSAAAVPAATASSAGNGQKTPLMRPAGAMGSPLLSAASNAGSPLTATSSNNAAAAAAAFVSAHQPRQAQWHSAWLHILKLAHCLVESAPMKWVEPLVDVLAASKRANGLIAVLSGYMVGKPKPSVEQRVEFSMLTTLITTIVLKTRQRAVVGGVASLAHVDVARLYPWVRRAFIWVSAHHKAFHKPSVKTNRFLPSVATGAAGVAADAAAPTVINHLAGVAAYARGWPAVLNDLTAVLMSIPVQSVHSTAAGAASGLKGSLSAVHTTQDLLADFTTDCLSLLPQEGFLSFDTLFLTIQELSAVVRKISRQLHLMSHAAPMSAAATPRSVGLGVASARGASPQRAPPSPSLLGASLNSEGLGASLLVTEEGDESVLMCDLTLVCGLLHKAILMYVAHWQYFTSNGLPIDHNIVGSANTKFVGGSGAATATVLVNSINVSLPSRAIRAMAEAQDRLSNYIFNFSRDFLEEGQIKSGLPAKLDTLLKTLERIVLLFEMAAAKA